MMEPLNLLFYLFYLFLYSYIILGFFYFGSKAIINFKTTFPIPRKIPKIGINDSPLFNFEKVFEEIKIFKLT